MLVGDEHFKSQHGVPNSSSASPFGGSDAGLSQNRAVQNRYFIFPFEMTLATFLSKSQIFPCKVFKLYLFSLFCVTVSLFLISIVSG